MSQVTHLQPRRCRRYQLSLCNSPNVAPTSFAYSAGSPQTTSINLTWTEPSPASVAAYQILWEGGTAGPAVGAVIANPTSSPYTLDFSNALNTSSLAPFSGPDGPVKSSGVRDGFVVWWSLQQLGLRDTQSSACVYVPTSDGETHGFQCHRYLRSDQLEYDECSGGTV